MKHFSCFFLSGSFMLTSISAGAQQTFFRNYTVEHGLPQATVYSFYVDRDNYLWFGTQGGAARFNGNTFFTVNSRKGLPDNHVTSITQAQDGTFWFGHRYEGISSWNGDTIISWKKKIPAIRSTVTALVADSLGNLWVATQSDGLVKMFRSSSTMAFIHYSEANRFISNQVTAMKNDRYGNIWVATRKGLAVFYREKTEHRMISHPVQSLVDGASYIQDIFSHGNDIYLLSDKGVFTFYFDHSSGKLSKGEPFRYNHFLTGKKTNNIFIGNDGTAWISTGQGILRVRNDRWQFYDMKHGLPTDNISDIIQDYENNIWFSAGSNGAVQYVNDLFITIDKSNGLTDDVVQTVFLDNRNRLHVGTEQGLDIISFTDTTFSGIQSVSRLAPGNNIFNGNIFSVYQDSKGNIWMGSEGMVFMADEDLSRLKSYSAGDGIAKSHILSIAEDKDSAIWLTSLGGGVNRIRINHRSELVSVEIFHDTNGLSSNYVWTVIRDGNYCWFGTNNAGLVKFDGSAFSFLNNRNGLPHDRPGSLDTDERGNLWIATIGGGVIRWDRDKFHVLTTDNGLSSDNPYFILSDRNGYVWAGTNSGVDRISIKTMRIRHFGKDNGFTGIETNQNACFRDRYGNLWMGTIKGVVKCSPYLLKNNNTPPSVKIFRILLYQKESVEPGQSVFNYDKNYFTFYFHAIAFTHHKNVLCRYMLEGLDTTWLAFTEQSYATYSNLDPGKYCFRVQAKNEEGVWSTHEARFSFEILPPFWRTWWFYSTTAFLVLLLIYATYKIRVYRLIQARNKLERLVTQRTHELEEEKKKVELQNTEIRIKSEIINQKNTNILDSITYAKQIQDALFPRPDDLKKIFPDSFVFYSPRDIVSGDFYWCANVDTPNEEIRNVDTRHPDATVRTGATSLQANNPTVLLACCDCTGHGVPGALMSMLGFAFLNEIVTDQKICRPDEVLERLREKIIQSLGNTGTSDMPKDGMDGVFLTLFPKTRDTYLLQCACANNPVWIVANSISGRKDIFEVKPDRQCIGFDIFQNKFSLFTMELSKNDMIYIATDGFSDQFGGPKNKKFKVHNLKKLLYDIAHHPADEQLTHVESAFNEWKKFSEQTDDVTVIGIRI